MDADDYKKTKYPKRDLAYVGDVLLAIWLRCLIQINYGYDWFVLDRRYRFLFYFGCFLYIIYFLKMVLT
jgi:hypothetical protein